MKKRKGDVSQSAWPKPRISSLEADIAYCEARLEFLGKPRTPHQRAQHKTFRTLQESLNDTLRQLKHNPRKFIP